MLLLLTVCRFATYSLLLHQLISQLFKETKFLTAPLGYHEDERQRVCRRFGLYDVERQKNIDTICYMAQDFFGSSLATVSFVLDDRELCASLAGFPPMMEDLTMTMAIPLKEAICAHLVTRTEEDGKCWIMDDVRSDWRFKNNVCLASSFFFPSFFLR